MNTHSIDLERSSTQYLSITDASQTGLDLSGDFTIEFWWKPEDVAVTHSLITKGNYNTSTRAYSIIWRNTNVLEVIISSNGTTLDKVNFSFTPSAGTYYHIAITCDVSQAVASEFEFFLNGSSQGNGSVATDGSVTSINNSADPFYIGAEKGVATAENTEDGLIDEVRVWNIIRTGTQINDNKYIPIDSETGLVGSWHLDNALTDSSGNSNTLTNNGSAVFSTDVPVGFESPSPSLSPSASPSSSISSSPSSSQSPSSSPSSSVSASQSPSSSPSLSGSASPSLSPSASQSPSSSDSPSPSVSESRSPSLSPSTSPSSSNSPSPSIAQYEDFYSASGNSYTDKYDDRGTVNID